MDAPCGDDALLNNTTYMVIMIEWTHESPKRLKNDADVMFVIDVAVYNRIASCRPDCGIYSLAHEETIEVYVNALRKLARSCEHLRLI